MSSFQNKMTSACRMVTAAGLLLAMVSGCGPAGDNVDAFDITDETDTAEPMVLVFAYFKASGMDPGDGLHLAASHDGYTFEPLRDDALFLSRPDGMSFRDPSIVMGPDETFHMVWTATAKSIGYAASTDLVNWTTPRLIPVMEHEPDALNAWAPEIFFDNASGRYVILWATTIPGRFPETDGTGDDGFNHRIYMTATTDFETFEPAELFYDPGFNVIDAAIVNDDERLLMFVKNETLKPELAKFIYMTTAEGIDGPWDTPGPAITQAMTEGPSVVRVNGRWHLYCDYYLFGMYELYTSDDLLTWTRDTERLSMPVGARHGTVLWIPERLIPQN